MKDGDIVVFKSAPYNTDICEGDIGVVVHTTTYGAYVTFKGGLCNTVWSIRERLEVIDAEGT